MKRYATHDYDSVLEMYYAKARFYDAHDRRFTAVDPILDPSGYDLREYVQNPVQLVQYLYVVDNPLGYYDPTGKLPTDKFSLLLSSYRQGNISQMLKQLWQNNRQIHSPLHILAQVITAGEIYKDAMRKGTTIVGIMFEAPIREGNGTQRYIDVLAKAILPSRPGQLLSYAFEVKVDALASIARSELDDIYFKALDCNGFLRSTDYNPILDVRKLFDDIILRTPAFDIRFVVEHKGNGVITYRAVFNRGSKCGEPVPNEAFYKILDNYYGYMREAQSELVNVIDNYIYTVTGKRASQLTPEEAAILGMATGTGAILISASAFVAGYNLVTNQVGTSIIKQITTIGGEKINLVFSGTGSVMSEIKP